MDIVGCDTFTVLGDKTKSKEVIFGKNSDRPSSEVQEIVYYPKRCYEPNSRLQCTYIQIEQSPETHAVILSKPSWMWGAEMGANEHGVCIGNEAVWTVLNGPEDLHKRLLGMDMVRLGLERSKTAHEAVEVLTFLLEKYGQGGPCSDDMPDWSYHNSFLITDRTEAWVFETAGQFWAAEKISSGFRNISNALSIGTNFELSTKDLYTKACEMNHWTSQKGPLNFESAFSSGGMDGRYSYGHRFLKNTCKEGKFKCEDMMTILRDVDSGICMTGGFTSMSSQVSIVQPPGSKLPDIHFFTGCPDPRYCVFKPFVFTDSPSIGNKLTSAKTSGSGNSHKHELFSVHEKFHQNLLRRDQRASETYEQIKMLEAETVRGMMDILGSDTDMSDNEKMHLSTVFGHVADLEYNFYKMHV